MNQTAFSSLNANALASAQPALTIPPGGNRVRRVDGAWRLVEEDRTIAIHSRDPEREAERVAEELLSRDPSASVVVTIGLGLGFLLDAFERRGWPGKVLALEPEPDTVGPFLARRDWRSWIANGRLRLLIGPEFAGASDCWSILGDGAAEPPVVVNPALARLRPVEVERARALVGRLRFDAAANTEARRRFAGLYLLNTLRNLRAIEAEADAASLFDGARGVPAILVAAGPSLESALPALRAVQQSALILAVDTALLPLLRAGVSPHLVTAVDPGETNSRHLTDLPPCPSTHLVAEASLDPFAISSFAGRTFLFTVSDHQPWPWLRSLGRDVGRLRAWGSVLTTTFDLALRMACDPVIFVGADLAFTGGRPYSRGVVYEEDWRRRAIWGEPREQQWAEAVLQAAPTVERDVIGRDVPTSRNLVAFRDWLVEQVRREPGRRFVNATGAGILHGAAITQAAPDDVVALCGSPREDLRALIRDRYRPSDGKRVVDSARALGPGCAATSGAADTVLRSWEQFAPDLTRERIIEAIEYAVGEGAPQTSGGVPEPVPPDVAIDADLLRSVAAAMTLVPMEMPAHRLERAADGHRVFRFRTMAARIIGAVLRRWDGAVCEDGVPLVRAQDLSRVVPGSALLFRDEVHFRATDDSDPRLNRRDYRVMVPACVEYLEQLSRDDVVRRGL